MDADREHLVREVLGAYRRGLFPMAEGRDAAESGLPLGWYRPEQRAVLAIDHGRVGLETGFRVPRRLRATVRRRPFAVTTDTAFSRVVRGCAAPRRDTESSSSETWIDGRIEAIFGVLHDAGLAHSVEAWRAKPSGELMLVGGVYGLAVGRVFCAESMFCRPDLGGTDASKVALVHLVEHCARRGFVLVDTQFVNPHLRQFGVAEIRGGDYQELLDEVSGDGVPWLPFDPAVRRFVTPS